jgi:mono/diheme cytochrome c family protein
MRTSVLVVGLFAASLALCQQGTIKRTPIARTSPSSGAEMYVNYCASCHGKDGKGNGPAAAALKKAPTDLTQLAKANGGQFPATKVYVSISGEFGVPAHGSGQMPVWGEVFSQSGGAAESKLRLTNLTNYIQSIQQK